MATEHRKLSKLLKTLHDLHGVKVDFNASVEEIREAYQEVIESKDRIIHESSFNNYFRDPEYTKHVLLAEAFRIFLSEIAPKRTRKQRRRRTNESIERGNVEMKTQKSEERAVNEVADQEVNRVRSMEQNINEMADREVRRHRLIESRDELAKKIEELRSRHSRGISSDEDATLSRLMEADLEQAEVMLAARAIGDDVQKMAERLASSQVEDLMPLVDRMKAEFGPEKAESFNTSVQQALQQALDSVRAAKDTIDNGVLALQGEAPVGGDMGGFPAGDDMAGAEPAADEEIPPPDEAEGGEEIPPPEGEEGIPDEFAGDEAAAGEPGEPVGRAKKEETQVRHGNRLNEVIRDYSLPPEINSVIDDFEYYVGRRHRSLAEAKERSLRRYKNLYGRSSLLPTRKVEEAIEAHVESNHYRLNRLSKLNTLRMPKKLKEAVERVGLPEIEFRDHLRDFLGRAIHVLPEPQYRTKLEEIAAAIETNPDGFVKRLLRLVEKREMAEMTGYDGYKGFRRAVIDSAREKRIDLSEMAQSLTESERDVIEISELHERMAEEGLVSWYNSRAFSRYKKLREALGRLEEPVAEHVNGLLERALSVIEQYRNEHGEIDEYGREMLAQLDRSYQDVSRDVEDALTKHLYRSTREAA